MTPEQIQLFITAAGSPAAIALGSSPAIIKVFGCIHEYIGLWWQPHQILREAKAQAQADATSQLIRQSLDPNATENERFLARGLMANEKTTIREQRNKESIVLKALPEVKEDAKPEEVEDDWYANFFDKSRLVSSEEMQMLWAKVLAGEVNRPGFFSKRTLALLSTLENEEGKNFQSLCRLSPTSSGDSVHPDFPLLYNHKDPICEKLGLTFHELMELSNIGLIHFDGESEFVESELSANGIIRLSYHGRRFDIFGVEAGEDFYCGRVLLTTLGGQIATLLSVDPVDGFENYVLREWKKRGYKVSAYHPEPPQET
ncbi:DUF2806 domain-containing protein [Abditibacterium utsteinense]|nr:DUF2806 domain-containing protein [Abditibacterium utsteinense]